MKIEFGPEPHGFRGEYAITFERTEDGLEVVMLSDNGLNTIYRMTGAEVDELHRFLLGMK